MSFTYYWESDDEGNEWLPSQPSGSPGKLPPVPEIVLWSSSNGIETWLSDLLRHAARVQVLLSAKPAELDLSAFPDEEIADARRPIYAWKIEELNFADSRKSGNYAIAKLVLPCQPLAIALSDNVLSEEPPEAYVNLGVEP